MHQFYHTKNFFDLILEMLKAQEIIDNAENTEVTETQKNDLDQAMKQFIFDVSLDNRDFYQFAIYLKDIVGE